MEGSAPLRGAAAWRGKEMGRSPAACLQRARAPCAIGNGRCSVGGCNMCSARPCSHLYSTHVQRAGYAHV
jgi:hypothetical protein